MQLILCLVNNITTRNLIQFYWPLNLNKGGHWNNQKWCCRDASADEKTLCSCRGPKFDPQQPWRGLENTCNSISWASGPSAFKSTCTQVDINTYTQTHTPTCIQICRIKSLHNQRLKLYTANILLFKNSFGNIMND